MRYPDKVRGIAFMEAVMRPSRWEDAGALATYLFKKLRDERSGYNLLIRDNYFVEKLIPMMSGRRLSEQEMDYYRAPYRREADRKPVQVWPQELPRMETKAIGPGMHYVQETQPTRIGMSVAAWIDRLNQAHP